MKHMAVIEPRLSTASVIIHNKRQNRPSKVSLIKVVPPIVNLEMDPRKAAQLLYLKQSQ